MRRATYPYPEPYYHRPISIHALLAESDPSALRNGLGPADFYPRSPCGERPSRLHKNICGWGFLSTLSLRRATIRSPKARARKRDFYPRSPCGERQQSIHHKSSQWIFLSTLSLRRATACLLGIVVNVVDFYPRSPCGERLPLSRKTRQLLLFLSTLSLRRATRLGLLGWLRTLISIHALLAESDVEEVSGDTWARDFYPRSPCGERPADIASFAGLCNFYPRSPCGERPLRSPRIALMVGFLSTLSLRRAT